MALSQSIQNRCYDSETLFLKVKRTLSLEAQMVCKNYSVKHFVQLELYIELHLLHRLFHFGRLIMQVFVRFNRLAVSTDWSSIQQ